MNLLPSILISSSAWAILLSGLWLGEAASANFVEQLCFLAILLLALSCSLPTILRRCFGNGNCGPTTVMDLMKAKREAEFPEVRRPKREIWIEPTLEDLDEFYRTIHQGLANDFLSILRQLETKLLALASPHRPELPSSYRSMTQEERNEAYWTD